MTLKYFPEDGGRVLFETLGTHAQSCMVLQPESP
jgi:hypothetical protein